MRHGASTLGQGKGAEGHAKEGAEWVQAMNRQSPAYPIFDECIKRTKKKVEDERGEWKFVRECQAQAPFTGHAYHNYPEM